jgi:protein-disulfide isomerase-like protein with CxxC motif
VCVPVVLPFRSYRRCGGLGEGLVGFVRQAAPGRRNNVLFWAACRAYAEGGDPAVLGALATTAEEIGLARHEVDQTMRSAQRGVA